MKKGTPAICGTDSWPAAAVGSLRCWPGGEFLRPARRLFCIFVLIARIVGQENPYVKEESMAEAKARILIVFLLS